MTKNDAPGMRGERWRNKDGKLRKKRGDTLVGNVEERYGVDFGVRSDMRLDTLRDKEGAEAISDLIEEESD